MGNTWQGCALHRQQQRGANRDQKRIGQVKTVWTKQRGFRYGHISITSILFCLKCDNLDLMPLIMRVLGASHSRLRGSRLKKSQCTFIFKSNDFSSFLLKHGVGH